MAQYTIPHRMSDKYSLLKICFFLSVVSLFSCHKSPAVFQGYIELDNLYLSTPFAGTLSHLLVSRGQRVKKNQLLFELDKNPEFLTMKAAQLELAQASAQLADLRKPRRPEEISALEAKVKQTIADMQLATIRVQRYQSLFKKNAVDKDTLDVSLAALDKITDVKNEGLANLALAKLGAREEQIKAQQKLVAAYEAKYQVSLWNVAQKTGYAPHAGIVFDTYYTEGEYVGAQKAIISLINPQKIHVEFFVPAETLAILKLNQTIKIQCYGCTEKELATVTYISPEAQYTPPLVYTRENSDKLVFRVQAHLHKLKLLKIGQPVTVYL